MNILSELIGHHAINWTIVDRDHWTIIVSLQANWLKQSLYLIYILDTIGPGFVYSNRDVPYIRIASHLYLVLIIIIYYYEHNWPYSLSNPLYNIWDCVFQFTHLPCDYWDNIHPALLSSSNRKYELLSIVQG